MTKINEIYKCEVCGNVVEILEAGAGVLVCCGKDMVLFEEKMEEEGNEKHKPVLTVEGEKVKVKVGSVEHPMEEKHYIELIEILGDGKVIASARLNPGDKPKAKFLIEGEVTARALCNIHGLWKS